MTRRIIIGARDHCCEITVKGWENNDRIMATSYPHGPDGPFEPKLLGVACPSKKICKCIFLAMVFLR